MTRPLLKDNITRPELPQQDVDIKKTAMSADNNVILKKTVKKKQRANHNGIRIKVE